MKVLFIGGFKYPGNEKYYNIYNDNFFSSDPLQQSIINGLAENGGELTILNLPFFPKGKNGFSVVREEHCFEGKRIIDIGFKRVNVFEHFSKLYNLKKEIKRNKNVDVALIYSPYFVFLGCLNLLRRLHIKTVCIVPDMPKFSGVYVKKSLRSKLSSLYRQKYFEKKISKVDGFVFLTKSMNTHINKNKVPYCVVEGIANSKFKYIDNHNISQRIVLYSGSLQYKYGLRELINIAKDYSNANYNCEFHFYGRGEAENEIISLSETNKKIKYFGCADRPTLHVAQQNAFVLINPRTGNDEFTKFSFPSKNLEYLLAARPVICYKLEGIPDEYDSVFIYPDGDGEYYLRKKIDEVLSLSDDKAKEIGLEGKAFAINEKNERVQAKKIFDLITRLI